MSPGLIYFSRAFLRPQKNIFHFFCPDFAKIAFFIVVITEGKKYPAGQEARRPFSVSKKPERDAGYKTTLRG